MDTSELHDLLARYWGYDEFRPLQRDAVEATLDGRDSLVVLPTGGGKSLCFQMPALVEGGGTGIGLVISPLLSLMKDQVDGLVASGVPALALNSSLTSSERDEVIGQLDAGRGRLLYVTPERVVGEHGAVFRAQLRRWGVRYIAVDEAHCISQWGHEFRPEYRQLAKLRDEFQEVSVHAFTATATEPVRDDIVKQLALRDPVRLVGSFDRPNLTYRVRPCRGLKNQILGVLDRHSGEAGIVYCGSRREVDSLSAWLEGLGHRALPYHAGLDGAARRRPPRGVPRGARRHHGGHGRLWHGNRPLEHPVRHSRRAPTLPRALSAGVGSRRSGRAGGRMRAGVFRRRLFEVASDVGAQWRALG